MELKDNQAALIIEASKDGEIKVDVAFGNVDGLAGAICQAIAVKLMQEEAFQAEIMEMIDVEERDVE